MDPQLASVKRAIVICAQIVTKPAELACNARRDTSLKVKRASVLRAQETVLAVLDLTTV